MANVSHLSEGLPKRHLIASYFVSLAIAKGLDYIVTNVLDENCHRIHHHHHVDHRQG